MFSSDISWVMNNMDENHGYVVLSGLSMTLKIAMSWPASLVAVKREQHMLTRSTMTQPSDHVNEGILVGLPQQYLDHFFCT